MTSNPFDLPVAAAVSRPASHFAYVIVAALLLGALLAYGIDLLITVLGAEPVAEDASDFYTERHDAAFFLFTLRYRLLDLLGVGIWGLLITRYLLERASIVGYQRPKPLLASLLAVSLLACLLADFLGQMVWGFGYPRLEQIMGDHEFQQGLVELLSILSGSLMWLVSVPLPLWLCLRLFRSEAVIDPEPLPVSRREAALLGSLTLATLVLQMFGLALSRLSHLGEFPALVGYYGTCIAVALVAFAGAWLVLPAQLARLRPLALIGACLVSLFGVVLIAVAGAVLLALWLYVFGADDAPGIIVPLLLIVGTLALCGLMQAFSLRVIYRPVAA